MRYLILIAVIAAGTLAFLSFAHSLAEAQRVALQQALCTTDSECMAHCPKADAECDGGPQ